MRWKIFTLIPVLMVVLTTLVTPIKVAAQGLVEYALILVVVGVGENETAEIFWGRSRPSQGKPQAPRGTPGDTVVFTYVVTNTGDATCTQTIQIEELEIAHEGLIMHSIAKGFGSVSFDDGAPVDLVDPCFKHDQSQRVVIQVSITGGDRGFKFSDNNSPFPTTVPVGVGRLEALGHSIYKTSTGETVASVVREVVPDGFVQTFPPSLPVP